MELFKDIPLKTKGQGSCFFHACFGENIDGEYQVNNPNDFRAYWHDFLAQFTSLNDEKMPKSLKGFLEKVFLTHTSLTNEDEEDKSLNNDQFKIIYDKFIEAQAQAKKERDELLKNLSDRFTNQDNFKNINADNINAKLLHKLVQKLAKNHAEYADLSIEKTLEKLESVFEFIKQDNKAFLNYLTENLNEFAAILDPIKYTPEYYNNHINTNNIQARFIGEEVFYQLYLNAIRQDNYYIFFEEIPILASLFN